MKHSASTALLRGGPFDGETRPVAPGTEFEFLEIPLRHPSGGRFSVCAYRFAGELVDEHVAIFELFEPCSDAEQ